MSRRGPAPGRAPWVPAGRPTNVLRLMAGRYAVTVTASEGRGGAPWALELLSAGHGVSWRWTGPDALDRAAAELAYLERRWSAS